MQHPVTVEEQPARTVVARRMTVTTAQLGAAIQATFGQLYGFLAAAHVQPAGPPCVVYEERQADPERWVVELCAPVHGISSPPPPGFTISTLAGGLVASVLHRGPYDAVSAVYEELTAWMAAQGYVPRAAPREIYLSPPGTPPGEVQTIVEWPVAKAPVAAASVA